MWWGEAVQQSAPLGAESTDSLQNYWWFLVKTTVVQISLHQVMFLSPANSSILSRWRWRIRCHPSLVSGGGHVSKTFRLNLSRILGEKKPGMHRKRRQIRRRLAWSPTSERAAAVKTKQNRRSVFFPALRKSFTRLASRNSFFSPVMIITNHELIDSPLWSILVSGTKIQHLGRYNRTPPNLITMSIIWTYPHSGFDC